MRGPARSTALVLAALLLAPAALRAQAVSGPARPPAPAQGSPAALGAGVRVHTRRGARATVELGDGSRVVLGPQSTFIIEVDRPSSIVLRLDLGKLWAAVTKNRRRQFSVQTPTAVAAVRGTEFS